jgi:hypothetical protein
MDIFCKRCGAVDGVTPADHDCMQRLRVRLRDLTRSYTFSVSTAVDFNNFNRDRLVEIEKELLEVYESMRDVTQWYSQELQKASRARDDAYNVQQEGRKWLNAARRALVAKLADVD